MSRDELPQDYEGANIHRLNKSKQHTHQHQEKQKQIKRQQTRAEHFLDQSPYSKQIPADKKQTIIAAEKSIALTPGRQKTLKKKDILFTKRESNLNLDSPADLYSSQDSQLDSEQADFIEARKQHDVEKDAKYRRDVAQIVENCQRKFSSENKKDTKKARRLQSKDRQMSLERYGMYTMPSH